MPGVKAFSKITTDETLLENARHGSPAFPFQFYYENIWDFDFHCVEWHWHPELEYVYVQSGCAVCFAGEEKMTVPAGRGLLINSRVLHRLETDCSTVIPNVVYSPFLLGAEDSLIYQKYLHPFLIDGPDCIVFDPDVPWHAACMERMQEIFDIHQNRDTGELKTVALLLGFWDNIYRYQHLENHTAKNLAGHTNQARLQMMMQYLHEHYGEKISLEEVASVVPVSKTTAMQIFSRGIHQSPIAYLIRYRLKQAAWLLLSTEKTGAAIAEETGFESAAYFCREFKKLYGVTPGEYRKRKRACEICLSSK